MNNQIKLNAEYEDARRVAECFVGAELVPDAFGRVFPFVGIHKEMKRFEVHTIENDFGEDLPKGYFSKSITIDTSKNQPCIYACMKHGLRVEVGFEKHEHARKYDFDFDDECERFFNDKSGFMNGIKSIRILDLEQMKGVKV